MTVDPLAVIRAGRLPEKVVPLCMALDLVDEYEALQAQLAEARMRTDDDSLSGGPALGHQRQLDALRERMVAATVGFRLRALARPVFVDLKREHPPRRDDDGAPNLADARLGVNADAVWDPLLRLSIVDPVLDEVTFRLLVDERLSYGQYDYLTTQAWNLNVARMDVPFSYAASRTSPTSEPE
jgi:hypothetical protein